MPSNLELLQGLREDFENLANQDEDGRSKLDNRGRMLIRRTFGEDSDYYQTARDAVHPPEGLPQRTGA